MGQRQIKVLLENWDIGKLVSCRRLEKGVVNINWIVKTSQWKYVLRKTVHFKNTDDLKFELNYLIYLEEHNFPYRIPVPIKTKNKEDFLNSRVLIFGFMSTSKAKALNDLDIWNLENVQR